MKQIPILFPLLGHADLVDQIHTKLGYPIGKITLHQFPDEESLIQIDTDVTHQIVILITSLDRPNIKLVPLLFAAETARKLGAAKVILISPYLAYMRQDKQFEPGQGITSIYFAKLISHYFDGLVTIDPHLHRWHSLSEIYSIPTHVLHATNPIAQWISQNIQNPLLIGPDNESTQWVSEIAKIINSPFLILEKIRKGDHTVEISIPHINAYRDCTPVLIDDIISTGVTLIAAINHLHSLKLKRPVCIAVHAVFAGNSYQDILAAPVERIITCNTIQHESNGIDVSAEIIQSLNKIEGC